mmetsp:Transcript_49005/g.87341  ORF Transcript_49005/g.87341 Transcript_49005/m.87341 type:complete len:386 (+) Transcript_49005:623-1780(+)
MYLNPTLWPPRQATKDGRWQTWSTSCGSGRRRSSTAATHTSERTSSTSGHCCGSACGRRCPVAALPSLQVLQRTPSSSVRTKGGSCWKPSTWPTRRSIGWWSGPTPSAWTFPAPVLPSPQPAPGAQQGMLMPMFSRLQTKNHLQMVVHGAVPPLRPAPRLGPNRSRALHSALPLPNPAVPSRRFVLCSVRELHHWARCPAITHGLTIPLLRSPHLQHQTLAFHSHSMPQPPQRTQVKPRATKMPRSSTLFSRCSTRSCLNHPTADLLPPFPWRLRCLLSLANIAQHVNALPQIAHHTECNSRHHRPVPARHAHTSSCSYVISGTGLWVGLMSQSNRNGQSRSKIQNSPKGGFGMGQLPSSASALAFTLESCCMVGGSQLSASLSP